MRFPLTVVLQVRLRAEEREEALLKQILSELAKGRASIQEMEESLRLAHESRVAATGASTTALDLCALYGAVDELNRQRSALEEQVRKLEQLRDKQMPVYRAARQNREMIEQLLERQRSAYFSEAERREQKDVGDIAVGQHMRRKAVAKIRRSDGS